MELALFQTDVTKIAVVQIYKSIFSQMCFILVRKRAIEDILLIIRKNFVSVQIGTNLAPTPISVPA